MIQKVCALCLPKKTVRKEKCSVPSKKGKSQQTSNQRQKNQVARLLDPHFESLTPTSKSGDHSDGNL